METRSIKLRPVKNEDLKEIFIWRNKIKFTTFFYSKKISSSYEEFVIEFFNQSKK